MAPPDGPEGKVEDQVLLFRNRSEAVLWKKYQVFSPIAQRLLDALLEG